jgi:hypothetical protein
VAPLLFVVLPVYISNPNATLWLQLGYGIAAIANAMLAEGGASTLLGHLTRSRSVEGQAPSRAARRLGQPASTHAPSRTSSRIQEVRPHAHV